MDFYNTILGKPCPLVRAKPQPLDLSHHLSRTTKNRNASSIKRFYKYFGIPGIGQLAGGLPNAEYFPFDRLEATVALPERWTPSEYAIENGGGKKGKKEEEEEEEEVMVDRWEANDRSTNGGVGTGLPSQSQQQHSTHLSVPHNSPISNPKRKIDVASALQYGTAQGYPPLYTFLREFTRSKLHPGVPYAGGPEIILTCGSTDGFAKAIQAFTNEWSQHRDPIIEKEGLLVEEFAYMNAIQTARPRGMNIVPVKMDNFGMCVQGRGGLKDILENWNATRGKKPHVMYTVTIGQNPTGVTIPVSRRREIYRLCRTHDIIIIEDDPYWYLQYPSAMKLQNPPAQLPDLSPTPKSGFPFLDSLTPSYLSIDVDGRVVRLDTFSKTVAPGCRLGWITAQPAIVERILRITETSTQQPSGFVQSLVAELLLGPTGNAAQSPSRHRSAVTKQNLKDSVWVGVAGNAGRGGGRNGQGWDFSGWVRWLEGLRGQYERRMNRACDVLERGQEIIVSSAPITTTPSSSSEDDKISKISTTTTSSGNEKDTEASEDLNAWTSLTSVHAYSFARPTGGMFIWLSLNLDTHPLATRLALGMLSRALWLFWTSQPYRVLVAPGTMFGATDVVQMFDGWRYMRICFAAVPDRELETTMQRLVDGVRDFWDIRSEERVKKIIKDDEGADAEDGKDDGKNKKNKENKETEGGGRGQSLSGLNVMQKELVNLAGIC